MTTSNDWDAWNFRNNEIAPEGQNLIGFSVQATDGHIGKIDEATTDLGASQIVVDTGPWIFGRRVVLPAGTIERVDWDQQDVYIDLTKDQIKDSPELATTGDIDPLYRDELTSYYGGIYGGRLL